MVDNLIVKAGKNALAMIRDEGFNWNRVTTYYGPASGPRWLIASGFDLTMMQENCLGKDHPVLLAGASSGAWRFAPWLFPEAMKSFLTLRQSYIETNYEKDISPQGVRETLKKVIDHYIEDDAIPFALKNKQYRLAVITARSRNIMASETPILLKMGFGLCFLNNAVCAAAIHSYFERIVFYSGPKPPPFCLKNTFRGRYIPLQADNLKHAILASGAIPLVVGGVRNIFGAPKGIYRDGGMVDYHINEPFTDNPQEITLFFTHQGHSQPTWMDKVWKHRQSPSSFMDNVLMVYPTQTFISNLPDGKVPDRNDFISYAGQQSTRIRKWWEAVEKSKHLGEEFLELAASGRIRKFAYPL
ncbi:MAG: HAD family hydrolase [Syntrophobacterales bacterium]|jgi:hypothetical protein|nr:HAD family hydrolase [Syntrophobacterales bacterium]